MSHNEAAVLEAAVLEAAIVATENRETVETPETVATVETVETPNQFSAFLPKPSTTETVETNDQFSAFRSVKDDAAKGGSPVTLVKTRHSGTIPLNFMGNRPGGVPWKMSESFLALGGRERNVTAEEVAAHSGVDLVRVLQAMHYWRQRDLCSGTIAEGWRLTV